MSQSKPGMNWKSLVHILAFWFGSGSAPKAPGTFGTLAAIPLYLLVQSLPLNQYLALIVVLFFAGVWICGQTANELGVHDHPGIVFDEVVGYLVTMMLSPPGWQWIVAGFVLFRIFDIFKPWPIGPIDKKVEGGMGIMLDDVIAGLFAFVCIQLAAVVM